MLNRKAELHVNRRGRGGGGNGGVSDWSKAELDVNS